eukprot:scaffold118081_cov51-Phaeocystis_antarctica.AAC.1
MGGALSADGAQGALKFKEHSTSFMLSGTNEFALGTMAKNVHFSKEELQKMQVRVRVDVRVRVQVRVRARARARARTHGCRAMPAVGAPCPRSWRAAGGRSIAAALLGVPPGEG